jgi:hypothetical protein
VVFWHVLDDGADGITLLDTLLDRYGAGANYVVAKNFGRGKDFSAYEAAPARGRARDLGALAFELPELNAATMRKIDHVGASLWASGQSNKSGLGLMDRQRVRVWTNKVYEQFDRLGERLFTPQAAPV